MNGAEQGEGVVGRFHKRLSSFIPRTERNAVFELRRQDRVHMPPRSAELQVVAVTPSNVEAISSFRGESIVQVFRRFLANKQIGVYADYDGIVVGHAWAALWQGSKRMVWGYLPVDASTACIYFCSVSPLYRGRKIYQNMLVELAKAVFESTPVSRILISCAPDNLPSYSAIERVGFRRLLILPLLRWRGHVICFARIPEAEIENPQNRQA